MIKQLLFLIYIILPLVNQQNILAYCDFTIPEPILLGDEFNEVSWHDDHTAALTRMNVDGHAVQFSFSGLTNQGAIVKDDYTVSDYGQILPSHGDGDFSDFCEGTILVWPHNNLDRIYVDADGPNDPGTGSQDDPFLRIQDALDFSQVGDIIEVRPGIYTGERNYNLDPKGKDIILRSLDPNDPETVASTIIDPQQKGRGFYLHQGESENCEIVGFTIQNAFTSSGIYGAGFYCFESNPTIRNCIIKNNHATDSGGGLYLDYSYSRIINCRINSNVAEFYGGGLSSFYSTPEIIHCVIENNQAGIEGGGYDGVESNLTIIHSILSNNQAANSGAMNCYSPSQTSLSNCTIVNNIATGQGGGICSQFGSSVTIQNCIVWENRASQGAQICLLNNGSAVIAYSNIQGGESGIYNFNGNLSWETGNIIADPLLVSYDPASDPNTWDFHLQSAYGRWNPTEQKWIIDSVTSSCIDTGDPNTDWSPEPWPNGKRINIGAFGGTIHASMKGNPADFNVDGYVNLVDWADLAKAWMTNTFCFEDLNQNTIIDIADIIIFVENWLWNEP